MGVCPAAGGGQGARKMPCGETLGFKSGLKNKHPHPRGWECLFAGGRLGLEFEHSKFALAIFKIASSKVACRIVEGFAFFKASDLYGPAFKKFEAFAVGGHTGQLAHQVTCGGEEGFWIFRKTAESRKRQKFIVALVRTLMGYVYKSVVNWLHLRLTVLASLCSGRTKLRIYFFANGDFVTFEEVVCRTRAWKREDWEVGDLCETGGNC